MRARLGDGHGLPGVEDTKALIARRMTPAIRRHVEESKQRFRERSSVLAGYKAKLTQDHRQARTDLSDRQRDEWERENRDRAARLPKGLAGLWHRLTGKYQQVRSLNESEAKATQDRHADARERLIETRREERGRLQERFRELRGRQAGELLELRREIGRYLKFSRGDPAPARARKSGLGLKLTP